jgi:hypothetical protein
MHIHIVNPQEERFSTVLLSSQPWADFPVQNRCFDIRDLVRDIIFHGIIEVIPSSLPTKISAQISVGMKSSCDNSLPEKRFGYQDPVWVKFLLFGIPIIEIIRGGEDPRKTRLSIGTGRHGAGESDALILYGIDKRCTILGTPIAT